MIVNDLEVDARFYEDEQLFLPFLHSLKPEEVVFLAGCPGSGKSTLARHLEELAGQQGISLQAVGMDGFHFTNAQLEQMGLADRKGAPETFDLAGLKRCLKERRYWPVYSRLAHDPVGWVPVTGDILLVEGNYLLLDEDGWRDLSADRTIFLKADVSCLKERLVSRKLLGGASAGQAQLAYASDEDNIHRILAHLRVPDEVWVQSKDCHVRKER